ARERGKDFFGPLPSLRARRAGTRAPPGRGEAGGRRRSPRLSREPRSRAGQRAHGALARSFVNLARAGAAVLALALAACGSKGPSDRSEWERQNEGRLAKEEAAQAPDLPPYPANERLIPFFVSSASEFKFFIDRASL